MNLKIDSRSLQNIQIPVLWGDRAIVQEPNTILSVIYIGAVTPTLEILRDQPAPSISFLPTRSGFQILRYPRDLYEFDVQEKSFTTETLDLPEVQIDEFHIRVGSRVYPNLVGIEDAVGLQVTSDDVRVGVPMPFVLSRLIDRRSMVAWE